MLELCRAVDCVASDITVKKPAPHQSKPNVPQADTAAALDYRTRAAVGPALAVTIVQRDLPTAQLSRVDISTAIVLSDLRSLLL